MTNKEKYRVLCEKEQSIPIFSQAWWLDSVAGEQWDVVLVEKNEVIYASLPYTFRKKYGMVFLSQPKLTQNLGPWIRDLKCFQTKKMSREKEFLQLLYSQLPKYSSYSQNWHYSNRNWLPLYWMGFRQTTGYTYLIDCECCLDELWNRISSSYRNKIRKAEKIVEISYDLDVESFYAINQMTFARQGLDTPYSLDFLKFHHDALKLHSSQKIFFAKDSKQNIHSALYLTWDSNSSYVHMVGEDVKFRNSGAGILLIWEVIKYTKNILKLPVLDFEGSMIESVERVRRDFGAVQTPYHYVNHTPSKLLRTLDFIRSLKN